MDKRNAKDQSWLIDPIEKMEIAIKTFEFALRLLHACEKKQLDPCLLSERFMVNTGGCGFSVEERKYTLNDLQIFSANLQLSATGNLALTFDETGSELWGELSKNSEGNLNSARRMMRMLRCAFAHAPLAPEWEIRDKFYRNIRVEFSGEAHIIFNGLEGKRDLHQTGLKMQHIGGWPCCVKRRR